ncbi:GNAT family N-acetyltransferase [Ruminococcus sp.]|uniref:GNAT family N-acetyltransferase n=1 Tax=Ruminococcus sp. TaxID=41978 RepID=UPI0025DFCFCA|nr:GNAT family N-acetyltransferase [Ruminococcus sp.]MBQ8965340.1 GNAT family N-acetyltransferase [Ruminococcus sp.]
MNIVKAECKDFETVKDITCRTINAIYPKYYPLGAVDFFLKHHSDENIMEDISCGRTFLCVDENGCAAGTVSVKENDIGRLFVLPEFQGQGCGRLLLDFAEDMIRQNFDEIVLDASLAAKAIYLKRGYREFHYQVIKTDNGDFLCFDIMRKKVKDR